MTKETWTSVCLGFSEATQNELQELHIFSF